MPNCIDCLDLTHTVTAAVIAIGSDHLCRRHAKQNGTFSADELEAAIARQGMTEEIELVPCKGWNGETCDQRILPTNKLGLCGNCIAQRNYTPCRKLEGCSNRGGHGHRGKCSSKTPSGNISKSPSGHIPESNRAVTPLTYEAITAATIEKLSGQQEPAIPVAKGEVALKTNAFRPQTVTVGELTFEVLAPEELKRVTDRTDGYETKYSPVVEQMRALEKGAGVRVTHPKGADASAKEIKQFQSRMTRLARKAEKDGKVGKLKVHAISKHHCVVIERLG